MKESLINVNFPINKQTSPNTVTNDYCFRLDWKLIEFLISKIWNESISNWWYFVFDINKTISLSNVRFCDFNLVSYQQKTRHRTGQRIVSKYWKKQAVWNASEFFFYILCNIFWVIQLIKILFKDFLKSIKRLSCLKQWKFISILTVLKGQGVISRKP